MIRTQASRVFSGWARVAYLGLLLSAGCVSGPSEKDIKQAEIQYDLGVDELRSGRVKEALRDFMEAVDLHPEFAQAHNGLGLVQHMLGNNDQAAAHFLRALELKPDFTEVKNNLARVYIDQGRFRDAIELLRRALDDVFLPERYLAESNLGWALFQVGEEEEGLRRVMNALAQNPKYCVGYEYLGLMQLKRKALDEALRELNQLVEMCPNYLNGRLHLAKVLLLKGAQQEGCAQLKACLQEGRMTAIGQECERLQKLSCPAS